MTDETPTLAQILEGFERRLADLELQVGGRNTPAAALARQRAADAILQAHDLPTSRRPIRRQL